MLWKLHKPLALEAGIIYEFHMASWKNILFIWKKLEKWSLFRGEKAGIWTKDWVATLWCLRRLWHCPHARARVCMRARARACVCTRAHVCTRARLCLHACACVCVCPCVMSIWGVLCNFYIGLKYVISLLQIMKLL